MSVFAKDPGQPRLLALAIFIEPSQLSAEQSRLTLSSDGNWPGVVMIDTVALLVRSGAR
jgi:hypothetical protein